MLGTKPQSTEFAGQLMYLSGGLAIAAGLCVVSIPVAGTMFVLLALFAQTQPGVILMLCDLLRLLLPVMIIVLLWTPRSRRYFRYVREGGTVEPRPRWKLGRQHQGKSLPCDAALVTDEDARILRDFLQTSGQANYPDSALAEAALAEGAARAARPQVADYVAEVLLARESPARMSGRGRRRSCC